ncbi:hypothetical protein D9M70_429510 [compost metagenome]
MRLPREGGFDDRPGRVVGKAERAAAGNPVIALAVQDVQKIQLMLAGHRVEVILQRLPVIRLQRQHQPVGLCQAADIVAHLADDALEVLASYREVTAHLEFQQVVVMNITPVDHQPNQDRQHDQQRRQHHQQEPRAHRGAGVILHP